MQVNKSNLWTGRISKEKITLVKNEILKELKKLNLEEIKMKKYVVIFEQEYFKKISFKEYVYQHLTDYLENKYFDTKDEAVDFINNYNLKYDFDSKSSLYVDFLSVFEYDLENEEIIGDNLYNRGFDIQLIEEKENIKISY